MELEKISPEEAGRMNRLVNQIIVLIEIEEQYTYQDVMRAIDSVKRNYEEKGRNLLNKIKIQEVAKLVVC